MRHIAVMLSMWLLALGAGAAVTTAPGERGASVDSLVAAAVAGDQAKLTQIAQQLKSSPRPARGDRRIARQFNEAGLALWQRQRFAEAAPLFRQAHQADPGDAEIAENLGYALLKSGAIAQAEPAILEALRLGPERASAWGTLGHIYAKQGKHRDGVSCVLAAYRFARNPQRALDVYSRLAATDEDPKVRAMLAEVVTRLTGSQDSKRS